MYKKVFFVCDKTGEILEFAHVSKILLGLNFILEKHILWGRKNKTLSKFDSQETNKIEGGPMDFAYRFLGNKSLIYTLFSMATQRYKAQHSKDIIQQCAVGGTGKYDGMELVSVLSLHLFMYVSMPKNKMWSRQIVRFCKVVCVCFLLQKSIATFCHSLIPSPSSCPELISVCAQRVKISRDELSQVKK